MAKLKVGKQIVCMLISSNSVIGH